jgi:hypothetical protein
MKGEITMDIETRFHERITADLEKLNTLEVGTDEYKARLDTIMKFTDRAIEIEKIHVDDEDKTKRRKDERLDRWIKNGISVITIGGQVLLVVWGTLKCLKFEETGTITTGPGKRFTNSLFSWMR